MPDMTFTEKLEICKERYQKILIQRTRLEEVVRQKQQEVNTELDKIEKIVGTRDLVEAEGIAKEMFEKMQVAFNELDAKLNSLQETVEIDGEGINELVL